MLCHETSREAVRRCEISAVAAREIPFCFFANPGKIDYYHKSNKNDTKLRYNVSRTFPTVREVYVCGGFKAILREKWPALRTLRRIFGKI
jgi:hypothetical protein